MLLPTYPSLAQIEQVLDKFAADSEYQTEPDAFNALPGLSYERSDQILLRGLDSTPQIEVPPGDAKRPGRSGAWAWPADAEPHVHSRLLTWT